MTALPRKDLLCRPGLHSLDRQCPCRRCGGSFHRWEPFWNDRDPYFDSTLPGDLPIGLGPHMAKRCRRCGTEREF